MLKGFTTKQLIFIALLGALNFCIAFGLGIALIMATGIPLIGGVIVNLFVSAIFFIGILVIRKFGTGTILGFLHMTLSAPTANAGPPGAYKIILGIVLGLVADIILYFGNYKKWTYYLSAFVSFVVLVPLMWIMLVSLNLPGADKLQTMLIPLMAIYGAEALIGVWFARLIYFKKLKNSRLVKQIQA